MRSSKQWFLKLALYSRVFNSRLGPFPEFYLFRRRVDDQYIEVKGTVHVLFKRWKSSQYCPSTNHWWAPRTSEMAFCSLTSGFPCTFFQSLYLFTGLCTSVYHYSHSTNHFSGCSVAIRPSAVTLSVGVGFLALNHMEPHEWPSISSIFKLSTLPLHTSDWSVYGQCWARANTE